MEVRCTKKNNAIRYEIPKGKDAIAYAKLKLKEHFGKSPYGWEFEIIKNTKQK